MRETHRENGREGIGGAAGLVGHKDFRDNLVSVFIDNLGQEVDVAGMWGIFKPFGQLRDVYLSPKTNSRRSLYAFIRFATREEAIKVVKLVNGMHVYGRPIHAKVAEYGWSNRRPKAVVRPGVHSGGLEGNGGEGVRRAPYQSVGQGLDSKRKGVESKWKQPDEHHAKRSFAEVVGGKEDRVGARKAKAKKLFWKCLQEDRDWLS